MNEENVRPVTVDVVEKYQFVNGSSIPLYQYQFVIIGEQSRGKISSKDI